MTGTLSVQGLSVWLGSGRSRVRILTEISFDLAAGTTLGVVGESGSGKSTLAKTIAGVHRASGGAVVLDDRDITHLRGRARRSTQRTMQLIPQDPYSSLDPRRTIGQTLAEAIDPRSARPGSHSERIAELLALVRLESAMAGRYPREFSGGQRQRIAIARALAVEPQLIIADEITSALDVSTQAEVLALLAELRQRLQLTMLFVSHNLAVVQEIADHVLVLYQGEVVESGPAESVFERPSDPYTRRLLDSVPGGPGFSIE